MMAYMSKATAATFDQEVIERSKSVPVVVDFWAEWCAPCRMLGPILEQAVEARGGEVWLVKIDTDSNQELAVQFGIRGIPAVKAFVDGRVAGEFVGLKDQRAVEQFLDGLRPAPEEQALRQAEQLLDQGQLEQVEPVLQPALNSPHHQDAALLLVARARIAAGDAQGATEALDRIDSGSLVAEQANALRAQGELVGAAGDDTPLLALRQQVEQDPDDLDARWALAGALTRQRLTEEALDHLLELLQRSREYREDGARRAMLAIFDELGPAHDLSREYRRKLQIYL